MPVSGGSDLTPEHLDPLARPDAQAVELAELRALRERFELAIEGTRDGLWDWNLQTDEAYHSDRFARMLGYEPGELPGTSEAWSGLLHPDDRAAALDAVQAYLRGATPEYESTFRMRARDGSYRWIVGRGKCVRDADGRPLRLVGFNMDITARKEAEDALQASEQRFRALFEKSPMGVAYHRMIYDTDGRPVDYLFLDANANYLELTGVDPRGKHATEAFPGIEHDPFDWIGTFARSARDGETVRFQQHLEANDRWYDCVAFQSAPDHFVAAFLEITDQRRLEEQLRQSQKMEAVGQLAGGVAHDFNNLLQVIQGHGELALEQTADPEAVTASLEQMMKAARRATALVSQLLAFSRRQLLEMVELDLDRCIAEMLEMLRRLIGAHIVLDFRPGAEAGLVRADAVQIGQVLTNLCVNARDAMPRGGRIRIATERVDLTPELCSALEGVQPGPAIRMTVADEGEGIPSDILDRVFDPFFTTKGVGEGTGLGLSTVYGLVQQHRGAVDVSSAPGQGTTFRIYLPRIEPSAT